MEKLLISGMWDQGGQETWRELSGPEETKWPESNTFNAYFNNGLGMA